MHSNLIARNGNQRLRRWARNKKPPSLHAQRVGCERQSQVAKPASGYRTKLAGLLMPGAERSAFCAGFVHVLDIFPAVLDRLEAGGFDRWFGPVWQFFPVEVSRPFKSARCIGRTEQRRNQANQHFIPQPSTQSLIGKILERPAKLG